MSIALNLFPVLSEEVTGKIGFQATNYEFSYHINGNEHGLEAKPFDENSQRNDYLQIIDERCDWIPDLHDLSFKRSYTLNTPLFLFGENGLACEDAELGLALLWTSKSSSQRGANVIGGFKRTPGEVVEFHFHYVFPPAQLKGSVNFQTVLFLKTPGTKKENENHLANNSGVILGTLDECVIIIDGNGSVFPIIEVEEAGQPLWWVKCDFTDPQVDRFGEENVRICLNKAHSSFPLLKLEDGLKGSPLLIDIVASALQIIIQKVKESEYWSEIVSGQNIEQGSIAQAIQYFITTFDWKADSPENLALSIRKDFDSRL